MQYLASIDIMPHKELLDPQGKTVCKNLPNIGITGVKDVRIGKHIEMIFEAADSEAATELVENACKKLLANTIVETYNYRISQM